MTSSAKWTRQQLLVALDLYTRLTFGQLHHRNPEILKCAEVIGRSPSALAMKLSNIASLDPAITSTGRTGLRSTSALDREMWDEMQSDWDHFALEAQKAMVAFSGVQSDEDDLDEGSDYSGSDVVTLTKIRVGQRFFRRAVLSAYNVQCCITGLATPALLVASHIVPWRDDPLNRVNPKNGLLLSALHDKAFDVGLITIDDDLTVRVSDKQSPADDPFFSNSIGIYDGKPIRPPEKFTPDTKFLAYHRENVFEKYAKD